MSWNVRTVRIEAVFSGNVTVRLPHIYIFFVEICIYIYIYIYIQQIGVRIGCYGLGRGTQ
jgi:hypothetical protein